MSRLEKLLVGILVLAVLAMRGWIGLQHYGEQRYDAGQAAAVAAGRVELDRQAAAYRKTESDLRATLAARDANALIKERTYAESLEAAQRRVRAGVDSLRCPVASPVPGAAPAGGRPTAGGPDPDADGPGLVPEVAADLLGVAADIAGLVRRYDRVVERFEACRALNAQ